MGEISKEMVRAVEQRESVKRLIAAAESKLESEKYEKTNAEQEIKFSDGREEKKTAQFKLDNIVDSIDNIKSEIKIRTKMISKLTDIIDDRTSSKSKISTKVRKNVSKKPDLRKIVKSSGKKVEALRRSVKSKDKQVESAKIRIKKISERMTKKPKSKKRTVIQKKSKASHKK